MTYLKNEKTTTNFTADNDEDVMNKAYLDAQLSKKRSFILFRKRL